MSEESFDIDNQIREGNIRLRERQAEKEEMNKKELVTNIGELPFCLSDKMDKWVRPIHKETKDIKEFIKLNITELNRLFNLNSEDQSEEAIMRRKEIMQFRTFMELKAGDKLI